MAFKEIVIGKGNKNGKIENYRVSLF